MELHESGELRRRVSRLENFEAFASTEVANFSRWLTASLLASNGAGALAVVNASSSTHGLILPGALFFLGLSSALLSGWLNQYVVLRFLRSTESLSDIYNKMADGIALDQEFVKTEEAKLRDATKLQKYPPTAGWVSFAFLTLGAISLSAPIKAERDAKEKLCAPLQREMLSDMPTSVEARERYIALACAK